MLTISLSLSVLAISAQVLHNMAVAENFGDGFSNPKKFIEVLNDVKVRVKMQAVFNFFLYFGPSVSQRHVIDKIITLSTFCFLVRNLSMCINVLRVLDCRNPCSYMFKISRTHCKWAVHLSLFVSPLWLLRLLLDSPFEVKLNLGGTAEEERTINFIIL